MAIAGGNKANIFAGAPAVGGYVAVADAGSDLPADAKTELAEGYKGLGYISENGVVLKYKDSKKVVKDWGKKAIAALDDEAACTFHLSLAEFFNLEVMKLVLDPEATDSKVSVGQNPAVQHVWVFNMVSNGHALRIAVPCGMIVNHDDINLKPDELMEHGIDIECLADDKGKFFYILKTKQGEA